MAVVSTRHLPHALDGCHCHGVCSLLRSAHCLSPGPLLIWSLRCRGWTSVTRKACPTCAEPPACHPDLRGPTKVCSCVGIPGIGPLFRGCCRSALCLSALVGFSYGLAPCWVGMRRSARGTSSIQSSNLMATTSSHGIVGTLASTT